MPPSDESVQTFGSLLSQAARQWRRAVDRRLHPFGLTEATWLPLIRLSRAPEALRQKELAASLNLDSSAVVRLLDTLQAAGLIERREEDGDRRAKLILLTDAGRAMVARVEDAAGEVRQVALATLEPDDIATTIRVLRHVGATLAPALDDAAS